MAWLNYHHLFYFWTVAREGSIAQACRRLHLTQPTVSGQLRVLERSLRVRLLERAGRSVRLTEAGQLVYRYADEIFALGSELQEAIAGRPTGHGLRFVVGVADALPKLLVHRLLQPALRLGPDLRLECLTGDPDRLLAKLALHEIDLVLSDFPANPRLGLRAFNHPLGECGISFVATSAIARRHRPGFPRSLDGAPLLLPAGTSALRRGLDQWFEETGVRPVVRGEFTDSALLKAFGGFGEGIVAAPTAVEDDVIRMYRMSLVGRTEAVRERIFAISVEKRLKHPAVMAIAESARRTMPQEEPGTASRRPPTRE